MLLKINPEALPAAAKKRSFVINKVHPYQGFFSVFLTVINYLDLYDKQDISGFTVDFKNHGLYYDTAHGPNSWSYYFEPLTLGTKIAPKSSIANRSKRAESAYLAEIGLSKERISELIKKYIRVKPEILKKADDFAAEKFGGKYIMAFTIAAPTNLKARRTVSHMRASSRPLPTSLMGIIEDYLIFVATDEEPFISYMEKTFSGKIVYQSCLR